MFLGSKKPTGKTVLLLDAESGSVGAGLLRAEEGKRPRLFGVNRTMLSIPRTVSAAGLAQGVVDAARGALEHASGVAARMRGHPKLKSFGEVSRVELFLAPPWSSLEGGRWQHEEFLTDKLVSEITARIGFLPLSIHPTGRPLASLSQALFPSEGRLLLASLNGEILELLLVGQGAMLGRATLPLGHHHFLRTLSSHGGLSLAEAHSALNLLSRGRAHPAQEALGAIERHLISELKSIMPEFLGRGGEGSACSVIIFAPEPLREWFARTLTSESLGDLFPAGGTVRALRAQHLAPYFDAQVHKDIPLMLEALYVDAQS